MKIRKEIKETKKEDRYANDGKTWFRMRIDKKSMDKLNYIKKHARVSKQQVIDNLLEQTLQDDNFVLRIKK